MTASQMEIHAPLPWRSSGTWASCHWSHQWWRLSLQTAVAEKHLHFTNELTEFMLHWTAVYNPLQQTINTRHIPWCSRSSWSHTRRTGRGELTWVQTEWTWRWPHPPLWSGYGPEGRRCPGREWNNNWYIYNLWFCNCIIIGTITTM